MFTLSAFADEISPDPKEQLDVLEKSGVKHIELRSVNSTNVLDLSDEEITNFKKMMNDRGFKLSAIGSPIGKVLVTDEFGPHLERFQRAIDLCPVFGTKNIRIFSYYLPPESSWENHRDEVLDRMRQKTEMAARAGLQLLHENEHNIYGDHPQRVVDMMETIDSPSLRAVYDPANYVFCGLDPWAAWEETREWTTHLHIKDWTMGEHKGRIPGEGEGQIERAMADAVKRGYSGFATLEPHLLGGGPTGGVTGPDLFPKAIDAFRAILDRVGGEYN